MIDLHSHIIPGIDDGAKDLDTAIAMLQMAADNGAQCIAATPHVVEGEWLPAWDRIVDECRKLQALADEAGLKIKIVPGAEVAIGLDILAALDGPGAYCINGGRYLLVELPATHIPPYAEDFFFTLQARGISPILAHAERHPDIGRQPQLLQEWIRKGVAVQMNGSSLTGRMGERVMKTAELLLLNDMVHCIGSDAHGLRNRTTNLTTAVEKIKALTGQAGVEKLLINNPRLIIGSMDIDLPVADAIRYPKKPSVLKRLLSLAGGK